MLPEGFGEAALALPGVEERPEQDYFWEKD
jgi:hypothetical protein